MARKLLLIVVLLTSMLNVSAQHAYNEAIRKAKTVAEDRTKNLEERKIAAFKREALYYMGSQAYKQMPDSSVTMLDNQALALYQFINLYTNCLLNCQKKERADIMDLFTGISLAHPKFHDPNKEYVLAYITNQGYLTRFSLDTDWVAAYNEAKKRLGRP